MKKILVVVDMQNDFITGSLGTLEAQNIVSSVREKISSYPRSCVYATRDTHPEEYLETQEGKMLPIKHCIRGSHGWELEASIAPLIDEHNIIEKGTFGSTDLAYVLSVLNKQNPISIELVGLCTDICVVSNALLFKSFMPEVPICVDARCCAGVSPASHQSALATLKMCQVSVLE